MISITGSKTLQYTLTAVESVLAMPPILSAFPSGPNLSFAVFKRCFKDLINPDFSCETSVKKKLLTATTLIQSLGFKYILDLANEQSQDEIDLTIDDSITNNESLQNEYAAGL